MKKRSPHSRRDGTALIIVLAALVLISTLVIGFFVQMAGEAKSSQSYASGAIAKQLAESAVQLASAQIADATQAKQGNTTVAWASQPGMIRTYDNQGGPVKFFRLYSSDRLMVEGPSFDLTAEAPPQDWDTNPGIFCDLNSPVIRGSNVFFPIIDPRAKSSSAAQSVEGFDYAAKVNAVVAPGGTPDGQRLPMPVRWLYVLQKGGLAVPLSNAAGAISFDKSDPDRTPSADNPIVGRIAFWTDDDTCKVNVNTASEGAFWDRPWANNPSEQKFSTAIPAQNEFQRYPGHPAMTSLSTVLGMAGAALQPPDPVWSAAMPAGTVSTNQGKLKTYFDLTPRIADGGTKGGTIDNTDTAFTPIVPDYDRLYASTDEFLYAASSPPGARQANNSLLTNTVLEKTRFFLTARSRAPEINLFGRPRITLWPEQLDLGQRNVKDKLIAFCSEIGGKPYYFQRQSVYTQPSTIGGASNPLASSQSATLDWTGVQRNQDLYAYLDSLTTQSIPGFGGNFNAKYSNTRRQILTEMFDLIRSGVNSYSNALTPSYNYTPTLGDPGEGQVVPLKPGGMASGTQGFGRYATITAAAFVFYRGNVATVAKTSAGAVIVPVQMTTPTQVQAALLLQPFNPSPGLPTWSQHLRYVVTGLNQFQINGAPLNFPTALLSVSTSRAGFSGGGNATPFFGMRGLWRSANDIGKGLAGTDATKRVGYTNPITQYPFVSPAPGVALADGAQTFDFTGGDPNGGGDITISIYAGADTGLGTPLQTIQMHFPRALGLPAPTGYPGQTYYNYENRIAETPGTALTKNYYNRLAMCEDVAVGNDASGNPVTYRTQDTVRGLEVDPNSPARGDLRFHAALSSIPSYFFRTSPGYDESVAGLQTYRFAHTMRDDSVGGGEGQLGYDASKGGYDPHYANTPSGSINTRGQPIIQSLSGLIVSSSYLGAYGGPANKGVPGQKEYRAAASPAVPRGLAAALNSTGRPGDFDNMTGIMEDGPFINKPDEGNSNTISNLTNAYVGKTMTGGYFSPGLDLGGASSSDFRAETGVTLSPNRQVSSAVMFGSLPTGLDPNDPGASKPWQTLLFCANPSAGTAHPGFGSSLSGSPLGGPPYSSPPDHLLLDLFTMPIVEPYAISEPFSTAGKINMNYQIVPFTYITRSTGVRAVLKSTRMMAIPSLASTVTSTPSYKDGSGTGYGYELRYEINPDEQTGTLKGFADRFQKGDIFRSAAEICGLYLVPKKIAGASYTPGVTEPTYDTTGAWWDTQGPGGFGFRITGDNVRERPYNDIYPRLTTKSNTYTVHYRVQTLKKSRGTAADEWIENRDQVTGESRGSTTLERYIDANSAALSGLDFATNPSLNAEDYYKIRTIGSTTFAP